MAAHGDALRAVQRRYENADHTWREKYEAERDALKPRDDGRSLALALAGDVPDMLATLGGELNKVDSMGWSALMLSCVQGKKAHAQALLSAGCDPHVESVRVVDVEGQFYQEGLDASSIATKRGNYCSDARNLAHYMFHTLNVEQRLLAAYRRLMLAAALEPHMGGTEQGSPLEWLEIELTTIAGCVGASTSGQVVDRFREQGFAWHGSRRQAFGAPRAVGAAGRDLSALEPEPEPEPEHVDLEYCVRIKHGGFRQTREMACGPTAAAELVQRCLQKKYGSATGSLEQKGLTRQGGQILLSDTSLSRLVNESLTGDDPQQPMKTMGDALDQCGFEGYGFERAISAQLMEHGLRPVSWNHNGREDNTVEEATARSAPADPAMLVLTKSMGSINQQQHWVVAIGRSSDGTQALFVDPATGGMHTVSMPNLARCDLRSHFFSQAPDFLNRLNRGRYDGEWQFKQNGFLAQNPAEAQTSEVRAAERPTSTQTNTETEEKERCTVQ